MAKTIYRRHPSIQIFDLTSGAENRQTAFDRCAPEPNPMLLDLGLPDSRGLETLRDVLAVTPRVPVVVLTGHADSRLGAEAVRAGAQDYLLKDDVTAGELTRTLSYAVERKKTEEELLRAKEKFERVFEISPVGLAMIDSDEERPVRVNETLLEQFGYEPDELMDGGVQTRDLWAVPDEWRWVVSRVLEGETVRNVEVRFRRAGGAEFDGLLSVAPLEVEDRRYWICAIGDISTIKEDERRLQATVRQPDTVARIGGDEFAVLLERADEAMYRAKQSRGPSLVVTGMSD